MNRASSTFASDQRVVTEGGRGGRVLARIVGAPLIGYLVLLDGEAAAQRCEAYELRPEPRFGFGDRVRDRISGKTGQVSGFARKRKLLVVLNGDGHPTVRTPADLEPLERVA